ncbi:MAG: integrase [Roseibium sp.]|nr:integrase [Roseibium sp.]
MPAPSLSRLMGGSPGQVVLRLVFLSFVVGVILSALDLNPLDLIDLARTFVVRLWNMGFDALGSIGRYFLLGAAVVLPIWLVLRFIQFARQRG